VAALAIGAALLVVAFGLVSSLGQRGKPAPDQLVPLYTGANAADWATACSEVTGAHGGSYLVADIGPSEGPGMAPVKAWAGVLRSCAGYHKASVLGYVWTDYGHGGMASVPGIEAQVRDWYSFYPGLIGGIFFDGASDAVPGTGASNVAFYEALDSYVHTYQGNGAKHNEVVLNFGANPRSGWMFGSTTAEDANIVVTFEGSYDTPGQNPYTSWVPAKWESHYPARDFAALVHGGDGSSDATVPQLLTACGALLKRNLGYVYVGTSYGELAPDFAQMVADC